MDLLKGLCSNNAVLLLLLFVATGCSGDADLDEVEARTARDLARSLDAYSINHSQTRPTNLFQVFHGINKHYPHHLHERFLPFGKRKGFSNSFYEKYVFPAPGVTNRFLWTTGEVLFLNAQPYKNRRGALERNVFCQTSNGYALVTLEEDLVQQLFWQAGREIPKPLPMPPPPPKPREEPAGQIYTVSERFQMLLGSVAQAVGLGRMHWLTVLGVIILFLLVGLSLVWLGVRKRSGN